MGNHLESISAPPDGAVCSCLVMPDTGESFFVESYSVECHRRTFCFDDRVQGQRTTREETV